MRRLLAALGAGVLVVVLGIATTASAATLIADDFNDGNADGWSTSGGSWSVSSGVYQQTGTSANAKAQTGSTSWTTQSVAARVRPNAFGRSSSRAVGVAARAQSMSSFYSLVLTPSSVQLRRGSTVLKSASFGTVNGNWYTLTLTVSGSQLTGSVNGTPLVSASDSTWGSGRVGLVTAYASAAFDDFVVTDTPGPPPSPTPTATATGSPTASPTPSPTGSPTASPSPSTSPTPSPPPPPPPPGTPDGFAAGTTGGAGGATVVVDTTQELLDAIDTIGPLIIQVSGTIDITSKQGVRPNKTIVGLGTTAVINGGGLDFYRSYNVIIRNLTFTNAEDDAVNVGQNSHHVWIDHNRFVSPVDGAIDIVRGAEFVTVSWNHFDHTDKTMLIGHSDGSGGEDIGHLKVTIHHNFFDHSRQRHPRTRWGDPVHVYNNYFLGNELYGIASTQNAGLMVEGNHFRDVPFPCFSASGYADSGPGRLVQRNNIFVNSGVCETNGSVADPGSYYSYTVDPPSTIPSTVPAGVGVGKI